ncbi:DNA repair protein RecO, partial [bacterium]
MRCASLRSTLPSAANGVTMAVRRRPQSFGPRKAPTPKRIPEPLRTRRLKRSIKVPEITVQAVVLRRRDAGETDRRLTILTPELGKLDVFAKGARKAASRLSGVSDPLSVGRLCLAEGKRNRYVTQAQPQSSFPGLRTDFDRLSMSLAVVELFAAILPYEDPDADAYELLLKALRGIEKHPRPLAATVWAQVALLSHTGYLPNFGACVVTEQPLA